MKDKKHHYQIVLVFDPNAEAKLGEKVIKKLEELLAVFKAKIVTTNHMGIRELVYEIKGQRKGDFWLVDVEAEVGIKLTEINLLLNRDANVLRYLIIKEHDYAKQMLEQSTINR